MDTNAQKIINAVRTLPVSVQEEIVSALQRNLQKHPSSPAPNEDEIERLLLAKGLISEIPKRIRDKEEAIFKPIKISGKPLSETVLEERE